MLNTMVQMVAAYMEKNIVNGEINMRDDSSILR